MPYNGTRTRLRLLADDEHQLSGNDSGVIFCWNSGARSHRTGLAQTVYIRLTRLRCTESKFCYVLIVNDITYNT